MAARQKLLLVSARWDHLGGHSGLAPLGEQLGAHFDVQRVVPSLGDKLRVGARLVMGILRERLLGVPKKQGWSPFYNRHGLLLETAALRMLRAQHFDVVFFEALEDHFDAFAYAGQRLSGTRIVGVSHQPPAWWRMYGVNGNVFAGVDLVIALSRQAQNFLQEQIGHANVHFVPHGVDVDFFAPGELRSLPPEGPIEVLFCGQWLRDFRQLTDTLAMLEYAPQHFEFHLVVPKFSRNFEQHYRLAQHSNVHWYAGLSDEELRVRYRSAHLMFLPLIDATANNSVLEAMSSGLPLVVSKVGGVSDYVEEGNGVFLTDTGGEHAAERLVWCAENYEACLDMAQRARKRAVGALSWGVVAARVAALAQSV